MTLSSRLNEFDFRYLSGALVLFIMVVAESYFDTRGIISEGLLFGILAVLAYLAAFIVYAVVFVKSLLNRKFVRATSILAGTAMLLLPLAGSSIFVPLTSRIDDLRFAVMQRHYSEIVAATPQGNHPKLVTFAWGETGFVSTSISRMLVYDESDERLFCRRDRDQPCGILTR